MAGDLKRVSGLWLKNGRSGTFMSGETTEEIPAGSRLLVFKNTKKVSGDKQPDYVLNIAPDDSAGGSRGQQARDGSSRGQHRPAPAAALAPEANPVLDDSEIPF